MSKKTVRIPLAVNVSKREALTLIETLLMAIDDCEQCPCPKCSRRKVTLKSLLGACNVALDVALINTSLRLDAN